MNILFSFLKGIYFNILSILNLKDIILNRKAFQIYGKIITINLIFLSVLKIFFDQTHIYIDRITKNTYFTFLYHALTFFYVISMYLIIYPFIYVWSLDGFGNLFNKIFDSGNNIQPFENISEKIYYALLGFVFYIVNNILYYIPYLGVFLCIIHLSLCYSFFCLDYGAQFNSIKNYNKLVIFENDPFFFISLGLPYGISTYYLNQFHFFTFFSVFFPLSVIQLSKKYQFNEQLSESRSKIFYFPIIILKYILYCVSSLLQIKYNNIQVCQSESELSSIKSKLE